MERLNGRIALITGAGSGIGRAIALRLADMGMNLVLCGRREEKLRAVADETGRPSPAPTMSRVVNQLKGYITKRIGRSIWQKLFYDHVVRNKCEYQEYSKYIYNNPRRLQYKE